MAEIHLAQLLEGTYIHESTHTHSHIPCMESRSSHDSPCSYYGERIVRSSFRGIATYLFRADRPGMARQADLVGLFTTLAVYYTAGSAQYDPLFEVKRRETRLRTRLLICSSLPSAVPSTCDPRTTKSARQKSRRGAPIALLLMVPDELSNRGRNTRTQQKCLNAFDSDKIQLKSSPAHTSIQHVWRTSRVARHGRKGSYSFQDRIDQYDRFSPFREKGAAFGWDLGDEEGGCEDVCRGGSLVHPLELDHNEVETLLGWLCCSSMRTGLYP